MRNLSVAAQRRAAKSQAQSDALLQSTAREIARKLAALPAMESIDEFAPLILEIMRGVDYRVWHILDEKPGLFGYMNERFYMLRQVRNSQTYGRRMFDGFTG
jgi:hypothetical protein